jgi:DNA-directed RNA polymerase beta subunit
MIRIGEVKPGDILIGKLLQKENQIPSRREIASCPGKAGDVKDASLKASPSYMVCCLTKNCSQER